MRDTKLTIGVTVNTELKGLTFRFEPDFLGKKLSASTIHKLLLKQQQSIQILCNNPSTQIMFKNGWKFFMRVGYARRSAIDLRALLRDAVTFSHSDGANRQVNSFSFNSENQ